MMCLIDDDSPKVVRRKLSQPLGPHQTLHTTNRDSVPAAETSLFGFFSRAAQSGRARDLACCLIKQLPTVREDQHPVAGAHAVFRNLGKYDRFAAARG